MHDRSEWAYDHRALRKARILAGLSIADLSQIVGLNRDTVADLLSGRTRPHPRTLIVCCEALKVAPQHVIRFLAD